MVWGGQVLGSFCKSSEWGGTFIKDITSHPIPGLFQPVIWVVLTHVSVLKMQNMNLSRLSLEAGSLLFLNQNVQSESQIKSKESCILSFGPKVANPKLGNSWRFGGRAWGKEGHLWPRDIIESALSKGWPAPVWEIPWDLGNEALRGQSWGGEGLKHLLVEPNTYGPVYETILELKPVLTKFSLHAAAGHLG